MVTTSDADALPNSVKVGAALLVLYGVAVVLNATVMQGAGGWVADRDLAWAVIRLLVAGVLAWGLLRRARWAWWAGVVLSAFWLAAGTAALLVLERGDVYWLQPSGFQALLVVALLALCGALALLLSLSARTAFRRPGALSGTPQA